MTWREVIAKTAAYLGAKGVPDPSVAGELLAARLLNCGRGLLAARLEQDAPEKCLEAMRRGMARLVAGEPLQYVLGEWDFRTLTLKCDRRALIPRPETEELVTRVLAHLNAQSSQPLVIDVGTGTGAIILALAKEYRGDAVFLEIGENQGEAVRRLMFDCGFDDIRIEKDYAGHDRYAAAVMP